MSVTANVASGKSLLCRVQAQLCAVPIEQVVETMRPLPVEPVVGAPEFVLGLAIVRGAPIPVVDASRLLGGKSSEIPTRFVTVRAETRIVALAVAEVIGIRVIAADSVQGMPSILRDSGGGVVSLIGELDSRLLFVLQSIRLISAALWPSLEAGGAA
jgi:purine-binding chemotaxis protein CheW